VCLASKRPQACPTAPRDSGNGGGQISAKRLPRGDSLSALVFVPQQMSLRDMVICFGFGTQP
jgi:hypothetical protein